MADLIEQLLAKNPSDRPASAADVQEILRHWAAGRTDLPPGKDSKFDFATVIADAEAQAAAEPSLADELPPVGDESVNIGPGWPWPVIGLVAGVVIAALAVISLFVLMLKRH